MKRYLVVLLLALAVAASGCGKAHPILAPGSATLTGGSADFSRYVAMGTSITAGTQSNGLEVTHQQKSYAYLFAQQINSSRFTIPSVSVPGIPALLRIKGVTPLGGVIINNTGIPNGAETNRAQATAFDNMGVPFSVLPDVGAFPGVSDTTAYYTPRAPGDQRPVMFDIVVRHRGTILSQVASLAPTLITFEYGSNEVLGPATTGAGTVLVPPANWAALLNGTLNALQLAAPGAKLVLFTVPDPTVVPYMTTFKPYALDAAGSPVALLGPSGPLSPADLVPLGASDSLAIGTGFPVGVASYLSGLPGNGRPLPPELVLSVSEQAGIRTGVDAYNTAVRNEAAARGAALVDMGGLLHTLSVSGLRYQAQVLTTAFVTGGLFSLDGVHPTDIAHGVLCNALVDAVNLKFGANVAHVDLSTVASATSSRALPAGAVEGALPWVENAERFGIGYVPWR